ncbi:unnamed protein product [Caenorhabditis brenneri]
MDAIMREHAERMDKEGEEKTEQKIRELRDTASGKLDEAISHSQIQHMNNLKKIQTEQENFSKEVSRMTEEDQVAHEARKAELLQKTSEKLANITIKCDAVTKAALDNFEEKIAGMKNASGELEKQIIEAKAKSAETEVNVERQIFDEVGAQLDKNEFLSEKRAEEIRKKYSEIQKEEQDVLAAEREEKKRNAGMTIAEIRSDLVDQQKVGLLNLCIQQSADERKSRKHINSNISEVKKFLVDLDEQYLKAFKVLSAPAEVYAKLRPKHKKAAKANLTRFHEILISISTKLNDIEQNLASFEWDDVEMTQISREIKTQISSFCETIAQLSLILELDGFDIDPAKTEAFAKAKGILFEQINKMDVISENRSRIMEAIQQRQEETMPNVATLSIEN